MSDPIPSKKKIKGMPEEDELIDDYDFEDSDVEQLQLWVQRNYGENFVDGLSWLRLYEEFHAAVESIRQKLNIDITLISQIYGEERYRNLKELSSWEFAIPFAGDPDTDSAFFMRLDDARQEYLQWQAESLPELDVIVTQLRLKTVGKIPRSWHNKLKLYVHLNIISRIDIEHTKRFPDMDIKLDEFTKEPYIELRIYGDTDRSFYSSARFRKIYASKYKALPNVFKIHNKKTVKLLEKFTIVKTSAELKIENAIDERLDVLKIVPLDKTEIKRELVTRFKKLLFK